MDGYFYGQTSKRQQQDDCDIPAVPGTFDLSSFSHLASQQAMNKQALAGVVQDYLDDRWKDRQNVAAAVFPGHYLKSFCLILPICQWYSMVK